MTPEDASGFTGHYSTPTRGLGARLTEKLVFSNKQDLPPSDIDEHLTPWTRYLCPSEAPEWNPEPHCGGQSPQDRVRAL